MILLFSSFAYSKRPPKSNFMYKFLEFDLILCDDDAWKPFIHRVPPIAYIQAHKYRTYVRLYYLTIVLNQNQSYSPILLSYKSQRSLQDILSSGVYLHPYLWKVSLIISQILNDLFVFFLTFEWYFFINSSPKCQLTSWHLEDLFIAIKKVSLKNYEKDCVKIREMTSDTFHRYTGYKVIQH